MGIIENLKMSEFTQAREVLEKGEYKGIKLRGNATLSYITLTLDGFQNSLRQRIDQSEVLKCTRITQLKNWPSVESLLADYGNEEMKTASGHFDNTLRNANPEFLTEALLSEWQLMKRVMFKRHGNRLHSSTWVEIYDPDFPLVMNVADIHLCIPPTSVRCETTFSHMKLIKTCRRTWMRGSTLSNLLLV